MTEIGDIRLDEMMPRLHEAWVTMPFDECLIPRSVTHRKLKTSEIRSTGLIPVIDQGESFISGYTDETEDQYPGPLPVVIFGDHTRRFKFVDFPFAVGADGTRLLYPIDSLNPKFFYHYLCALNLESQGYSRHYKFLKEALVPVPPLPEQRRIIAKLEKLLGKVDACQKRLDKIPILLKRFRQSVLAAACSGRLTEDWRETHPEAESANDVVNQLRRRLEATARSVTEREKLRNIWETPDESGELELPEGWRFVSLSKLSKSFDYGTSTKSQPSGKVPVLRMGNIQNGRLNWDNLVYTSDAKEIAKYSLKPNTVLFNRTNSPELVGKTAIYFGERPAIFAGYLIRVNPFPELNSEYLNLCLNTDYAREFCSRVKTDGVSQSNINAQKLGSFAMPFCWLNEQQEIVRRVEALFALANQIETRYTKAKAQVDKLTQSILAKAFRGELVPQDPNDEPAEELLKRIREARATESNDGAKTRRKVAAGSRKQTKLRSG